MLVDSHCHLDLDQFDNDRTAVVERARTAGVAWIVNPGIDLPQCRQSLAVAAQYPEVYLAMGIHPNSSGDFNHATVDELRTLATHPKVVAIGEIGLAYDGQGVFDVFAHRLFKHVKTPHEFLLEPNRNPNQGWFDIEEISDVIAAIHMLRFPLVEPKRMAVALGHFEQTLSLSRQMWERTLAETDDDREWVPNPKQKGAINIPVTQEMIDNWLRAVDEMESILQGKKLLPFWRGKLTRGVNLRRVFLGFQFFFNYFRYFYWMVKKLETGIIKKVPSPGRCARQNNFQHHSHVIQNGKVWNAQL